MLRYLIIRCSQHCWCCLLYFLLWHLASACPWSQFALRNSPLVLHSDRCYLWAALGFWRDLRSIWRVCVPGTECFSLQSTSEVCWQLYILHLILEGLKVIWSSWARPACSFWPCSITWSVSFRGEPQEWEFYWQPCAVSFSPYSSCVPNSRQFAWPNAVNSWSKEGKQRLFIDVR